MDMQPGFLRTAAAAAYCGLSPRTLENLRLRRLGPRFIRIQGHRFVCYAREDIDTWMRSGLQELAAEKPKSDERHAR